MVSAGELKVTSGAVNDCVCGAMRAAGVAPSGVALVSGEGGKRRDGHERPGTRRLPGPAGPMPESGQQPAADCQRQGTPEQPRTYKLTVRVIAELYPPLTNERRWAFQNAIALSRGHPLIRAAARWDKLDEATVTIECQACDAAAAAEAARGIIRRTAGFTGEIGVRDIKVTQVAPAG
jgi:hypothetical protein